MRKHIESERKHHSAVRANRKNNKSFCFSGRKQLLCIPSKSTMWNKPYTGDIESVHTGLGKNYKYSPIFKHPIAEAYVELTGDRRKDYLLAEQATNIKHIPGETVWHHAWKTQNGKYLMQLVELKEHQKTCPHAGGFKKWKDEHGIRNRQLTQFVSTHSREMMDGYSFGRTISGSTVGLRIRKTVDIKRLSICGFDACGNAYYRSRETGKLYFYDHEYDRLIPMKRMSR